MESDSLFIWIFIMANIGIIILGYVVSKTARKSFNNTILFALVIGVQTLKMILKCYSNISVDFPISIIVTMLLSIIFFNSRKKTS